MVKEFKHTNETIRIQIKRLETFKSFMTEAQVAQITKSLAQIMTSKSEDPATIKKKTLLIQAYRILAGKYSEKGDHGKAQSFIKRAEDLTLKYIQNPNNVQTIMNKQTGVELLLR